MTLLTVISGLLDRVWSSLAEFILLGEAPPAGPVPTSDELDERRFRREVLQTLAYVWAGDVDEALREKQTDIDRYTSADYWLEHPELHTALQTGLGLLQLFAMQMDRAVWASEPETEAPPQPAMPGDGRQTTDSSGNAGAWPDDGGKERYRAFLEETHNRHEKGRSYTEDARQVVRYWEDEVRDFPNAEFWDDKHVLRAGLKSAFTLLRLFTDQVAQTIEAKQKENAAKDPELGQSSLGDEQ